jgi:long-subunit fatty acid transport protein
MRRPQEQCGCVSATGKVSGDNSCLIKKLSVMEKKMGSTLHARIMGGAFALLSTTGFAAMGTVASSYGILPGDVASAQALSLFNADVSSVYYNPAALAADPRGELTLGTLVAEHRIEATSLGGSAPMNRQGDLLPVDESEQTLIGMKTNLSSMTKVGHPLYFGIMIGVEKIGREMMAFQSGTSTQGQYVRYGRQPLFLTAGGATRLVRGIDGGLAFRVTLNADATLSGYSDLAGNTQYEELQVSAKPKLTLIVGGSIAWGELLCPDSACTLKNWQSAVSWRAASKAKTNVNANVVIPGTIPPPGLNLVLGTLDSYQPEALAVGLEYKGEKFRAGITAEWQQWSQLDSEFADDTVRNQANLRFADTLVPRLGGQYRLDDTYTLTAGLAFEPAVLESDRSLDVNYLDNDRYIVGVGASALFRQPWIFAHDVRLDVGYQLHLLQERSFQLTSSQSGGGAPYETLETGGHVHVLAGSLTLKF